MNIETYKSLLDRFCTEYPNSCIAYNRIHDKSISNPPVDENGNVITNPLCWDNNDSAPPDAIFDVLPLCGCGNPNSVAIVYHKVLQWVSRDLSSRHDNQPSLDNTLFLTILYVLNDKELIEHGSSVYNSWITKKGKIILHILNEWQKRLINE